MKYFPSIVAALPLLLLSVVSPGRAGDARLVTGLPVHEGVRVDGVLDDEVWREGATIGDFVQADPYVANGIVTGWRVRPWTVVIGA